MINFKKRTALLVALLLLLAGESTAQPKAQMSASDHDNVVSNIIKIGQTDNRTMHHLDVLTNRIGGRLLGSDAYENATYWAADLYKKWG
ncbi:hypothetical protein MASR1M46_10760 [Bacteroidales bacterium]